MKEGCLKLVMNNPKVRNILIVSIVFFVFLSVLLPVFKHITIIWLKWTLLGVLLAGYIGLIILSIWKKDGKYRR